MGQVLKYRQETARRPGKLMDGPLGRTYYTIIYAIEAPEVARIKIGRTEYTDRRFRALQSQSPVELRMIGSVWLPSTSEAALHDLLRQHRLHGEWFRAAGEVLEISELIAKKKAIQIYERLSGPYSMALYSA